MQARTDVIVCSFFTDDDYYRGHADNLRKNLDELGLLYELKEIHKAPGEEWPDICRKKIGFIAEVCLNHPDKKVFWIDVDCNLLAIPEYVLNSTADLIGFTRGFGSALQIGYGQRARFWEPCFWGLNTTAEARKLIKDASNLEKASSVRATDDYFLEEAWRANAENLTFQIIPSGCVVGRSESTKDAFFTFGSSGNVAEFKGKVEQHTSQGAKKKKSAKARALGIAKIVEAKLPQGVARKLRRIVDGAGITDKLVAGKNAKGDPIRAGAISQILDAGMYGSKTELDVAVSKFQATHIPTSAEAGAIEAATVFSMYAAKSDTGQVPLAWWTRPFPGNFGDWLSPLIVSNYTDLGVIHQSVSRVAKREHIIGLGSIGRFIKSNSIVAGTGISTDDLELNKNAKYVSVRGPITAGVVKKSGGPEVTSFGDPGILLSRVLPITRAQTNGRVALVRHYTHADIPVTKPENMDELNVLVGHPDAIKSLLVQLSQYDSVVTSAMHIYIACQSYGIPCALITFAGFEDAVHGTGIKYQDYSLGVDLPAINPEVVALNLNLVNFDDLTTDYKISEAKLDEVETALRSALALIADK
ncbi:MAG: hypothetical protein KGQ38_01985 [Actinomycetales bacterium]|nr:hypothetical protein [Actinomycetales bacterium]